MVRGADRMSDDLKKIIKQNEQLLAHLADIRNDLRIFREFVLEVTPQDAQKEIEALR